MNPRIRTHCYCNTVIESLPHFQFQTIPPPICDSRYSCSTCQMHTYIQHVTQSRVVMSVMMMRDACAFLLPADDYIICNDPCCCDVGANTVSIVRLHHQTRMTGRTVSKQGGRWRWMCLSAFRKHFHFSFTKRFVGLWHILYFVPFDRRTDSE